MSVLEPSELAESPLADLHAIASELGIEGYRRLRREALIAAILESQGVAAPDLSVADEAGPPPGDESPAAVETVTGEPREPRREEREEEARSGFLDIVSNGSGFLRSSELSQSRDDVYVSPAQIKRCELRPGDEVAGPIRGPRRSERYPSLVRVETVNGAEAEPPPARPSFDELTPIFPTERLSAPDALASLPFGRGSRVAVGGPPGAGATTLLRLIADTLREKEAQVELAVVLAGVRPEEMTEWRRALEAPVVGGSFDGSPERQVEAATMVVERAKRTAERGGHAAVVIDSLDALPPAAARKLFGAARNTEEAGSVTVFAATGLAAEPQRQATTRIVLEPPSSSDAGAEPSIAAEPSGTLRFDLLS